VVFFPKTLLPLHIFEPRYRTMIADALRGDQTLCVALLQSGWEADYEGSPPVHPVACVGRIVQHEQLADGRYNIVLQGEARVMIEGYERLLPYRVGRLRLLEDDAQWATSKTVERETAKLVSLFRERFGDDATVLDIAASLGAQLGPEAIVNSIAMHMDVEPRLKQFLLEIDSVGARYRSVIKILNQALTTQDRIDQVRHRLPEDPSLN